MTIRENKKMAKVVSILLAVTMILSSCGIIGSNTDDSRGNNNSNIDDKSYTDDTSNNSQINQDISANSEKITVQQLKAKYATAESEITDKNYIRPFYNVEQTTRFTFHFNSKIEPYKAITVHTDPKCGVNSTVYQINDGYLTEDGVDVVVKPGSPILNTSDRKSGELENYNWGNAPIYYICIHYDMYSNEIKELDEPVIIPFTIKSPVSIPNVTYSVDSDGTFRLNWLPVDDAVKYNIYKANPVKQSARDYTRSECAYIGDHLKLLTTVSGDTTTFTDFNLDGKDSCNEYNGYILQQNTGSLDTFYVTAEDSRGNESLFSMAIEGWRHKNQLPFSFDDFNTFVKNDDYQIDTLPETVFVTMADKTTASFPINYTKLSDNGNTARYMYQIPGTRLTGEILGDIVYKVNGEFPDKIESSFAVDTAMYNPVNNINIIPSNDVMTYSSDNLDLSHYTDRGETNKFIYDKDEILVKADAEAARIITDGIYMSDPSDIFTTTYTKEYKSDNSSNNEHIDSEQPDKSQDKSQEDSDINTSSSEDKPDVSIDKPDISDNTDPIDVNTHDNESITADNVVEEQIKQTQEDVAEAEQVEIVNQGYKVFADSAEEEYLATQIVNCEEEISLKAFPKLQNCEYLVDAIMKVHYQNPYDMGLSKFEYDPSTQILNITYSDSKENMQRKQKEIASKVIEINNSIIKSEMTKEEKIEAIWNYLENNTKYDNDALESAEATGFKNISTEFCDAFTAYGILCKQKGVCQSYAYATKLLCDINNIKCNILTGYMNKTLPHGWNAIELDSKWYWIDTTNNENTSGIPHMLYQSSADFALGIDYTLDNFYDLDTNLDYIYYSDDLHDWYTKNNMMASSSSDASSIIMDGLKNREEKIFVKIAPGVEVNQQFIKDIAVDLMKSQYAEEVQSYNLGYTMGYIFVMK